MAWSSKVGSGVWYAAKLNKIRDVIEVYEVTQSDSAALDVAVEFAELVGIGIPLWFIDKAVTKTGLDRVFDSLKKNKSFQQYLEDQAVEKNLRDVGLGELGEWALGEFSEYIADSRVLDSVFDGVNNLFNRAFDWFQRRDPLTLDLDGDGIETLAVSSGILFDHNGDGIKTGSGWVAPDDGMLVLDKNGNGLIDSGDELFGDSTTKSDGQLAKDGFDALADLDDNGDGVFDASDLAFSQVQLWQDANSDGISQTEELRSLADVGVVTVNLNSSQTNTNLGDGNVISAEGTFEWADGSEEFIESSVASLDLAANPFYREFTNTVEIPAELQDLPDMQGSGAVRDLLEAAATSPTLASTLEAYKNVPTKEEQLELLDQLLADWADSADFEDFVERIDGTQTGYTDALGNYHEDGGKTLLFRFSPDTTSGGSSGFITVESDGTPSRAGFEFSGNLYDGSELKVGAFTQDSVVETLAKIRVLEVFNAREFFNFDFSNKQVNSSSEDQEFKLTIGSGRSVSRQSSGVLSSSTVIISDDLFSFSSQQQSFINSSYSQLKKSVYDGLLLQTRLKPALDAIEVMVAESGKLGLNFVGVEDYFSQKIQLDSYNAHLDLLELDDVMESELAGMGWNPLEFIARASWETEPDRDTQDLLAEKGVQILGGTVTNYTVEGSGGIYLANDLDNAITAAQGDEKLYGLGGNDTLVGLEGKDTLDGGDGNDTLQGGAGANVLLGGAGDDHLFNERYSSANSKFTGGVGNDTLVGGYYRDYYYFNLGDGQDVITDNGAISSSSSYHDHLIFGEGIAPEDMLVSRQRNDIVLSHLNGRDEVTIKSWFAHTRYQIENIKFNDGTTWVSGSINAQFEYMNGTADDDLLTAFDGQDDFVRGSNGNDVLDGGTGNDVLIGGDGNDVMTFSTGDGQDQVLLNPLDSGQDTIQFVDTFAEDLWFSQVSHDLLIQTIGSDDSVTVKGWFTDGQSEQVIQATDYTLNPSTLELLINAMAAFDPPQGAGYVLPQETRDELAPELAASWS